MQGCPSEDTIVGFIEQRLPPARTDHIHDHVASCAPCRRLVSAAIRDGLVTPPDGDPLADTVKRPSRPRLALDARFGRYRIEAELGSGGMGKVYAAFDPALERRVALKVLHDGDGGGLVREARAMARLVHPNVVAVHEVGRAAHRDYIAMELVDGETLDHWVRRARRSRREIVDAFVAAGCGLAAAHAAGIVHGDFKPNNVLRDHDGRIVVTDFGLARAIGDVAAGDPAVVGTPAYMAPEQWRGEATTAATDQFAFCVALWEALAGARPYRGTTARELREAVGRGPDALDRAGLPRRLAAILRRGLRVDPAARWPSVAALVAALRQARRSSRIAIATGAAVTALGALGLAAWLITRASPEVVVACPAPQRDLATVWSPALANALRAPADVVGVLGAAASGWSYARAQACLADRAVRTRQLACLDGVLVRFDGVRRAIEGNPALTAERVAAQLVDASVCAHAAPPRLAPQLSAAAIAALGGATAVPAGDACGRALARLASARGADPLAAEVRDAADDAIAAAEQCGDDRMLFDALVYRANFENNSLVVDPKLVELAHRVDALLERVAQPDLVAAARLLAGEIAGVDERWDDSLAAVDAAIAGYPPPFVRARLHANVVKAAMLWVRGRVAEVREVVARWRPVARALGETRDLSNLEFVDGMAAWLLGDVAGAHARLEAVRAAHVTRSPTGIAASGVVVDRAGRPVAGATVAFGALVYSDSVGIGLALWRAVGVRFATTGGDGRFSIEDAPALGTVIAERGAERSLPMPLTGTNRLVLQPTSTVRGRVDRRGTTAMTMAIAESDSALGHGVIAPIAADGTFELRGVPRGRGRIGTIVMHGIARSTQSMQPIDIALPDVSGIELTVEPGRDVEVIVRSTSATALDGAVVFGFRGNVAPRTVREAHGVLASAYARPIARDSSPGLAQLVRPGDVVATLGAVPRIATTVCAGAFAGDLADHAHVVKLMQHAHGLQCRPLRPDSSVITIDVPPMKRLD